MGLIWKDKRCCTKGLPEMYRMFEMHDQSYVRNFNLMNHCIAYIQHYGERYGTYFAPEFVVHCRRHGDPFRCLSSSSLPFPSGRSFSEYLYAREMIGDPLVVIDLTTDAEYDSGVPSIDLSDDE